MTKYIGQPWAVGRGMYHAGQEVVGLYFAKPTTGLPDIAAVTTKPILMAIHANGDTVAVTDDLRLTGSLSQSYPPVDYPPIQTDDPNTYWERGRIYCRECNHEQSRGHARGCKVSLDQGQIR